MTFDYQPTLRGELLTLRPLAPGDWEALYQVASDSLLWEQHPARNRCEKEVFRSFFEDGLKSGGALLASDNKTGSVIGSSRFHNFDPSDSEVEIGWSFLARSHWGGVYNGEMKRLMLHHAFQFAESVLFLIGPDNLRSRRATEKIGATLEGARRDAYGLENVLYRLRKGDCAL